MRPMDSNRTCCQPPVRMLREVLAMEANLQQCHANRALALHWSSSQQVVLQSELLVLALLVLALTVAA